VNSVAGNEGNWVWFPRFFSSTFYVALFLLRITMWRNVCLRPLLICFGCSNRVLRWKSDFYNPFRISFL